MHGRGTVVHVETDWLPRRLTEKALWRDPDDEFDGGRRGVALTTTWSHAATPFPTVVPQRTVADEERLLDTIGEDSQDCIVSNLGLHWVNDLPGERAPDCGNGRWCQKLTFRLADPPRRARADPESSQAGRRVYRGHVWRRHAL